MDVVTECVTSYNNPALENYKCEGQMDIFDVFSDLVGDRLAVDNEGRGQNEFK